MIKEPTPTVQSTPVAKSSGSVGGKSQTTGGTATATKDFNDKPTRQEFDVVVASSRRASVGKTKGPSSEEGRNGSGRTDGLPGQTGSAASNTAQPQANPQPQPREQPKVQGATAPQTLQEAKERLKLATESREKAVTKNNIWADEYQKRVDGKQSAEKQEIAWKQYERAKQELVAAEKELTEAKQSLAAAETEGLQPSKGAGGAQTPSKPSSQTSPTISSPSGQPKGAAQPSAQAEQVRQQEEKERLRKQQEEAAERERLALEAKAERERQRLAQEAAERERLAEAQRVAKQQEEARRAEEGRKAREEQTRQEAAKRLAEEQERQRKEAEERKRREEELKRQEDERQRLQAEAERQRLAQEAAAKKKREEEAKTKTGAPQKGPTPKPPTTTAEVKERAAKLNLSPKEKSAVEALPQKVAASVVVALEGFAALGKAGELAETRAKEADATIKKADATIQEAGATIQEADTTIENADEKVNDAISAQFDHITDAVLNLWQALGKRGLDLPEFPAKVFNETRTAALKKFNTHKPGAHAAAVKDLETFWAEMKKKSAEAAQEAEKMKAMQDFSTQKEVQQSAEKDKERAASTKADAANAKADAEKAKEAAANAKADAEKAVRKAAETTKNTTALLNAVRFGPLSRPAPDPDTVPGLSTTEKQQRKELAKKREQAASDVIAGLGDHPRLALDALDVIQRVEHPDVVARGVADVGKLQAGNFAKSADNPAQARAMARTALEMGGLLGGDYFDRMNAYYEVHNQAGKPPAADPMRASGADATKKTILNYTAGLGRAILDANGAVNLDAKGAKDLRDALSFHPDSLKDPLPAVALRVEKFRDEFNGPNKEKFVAALESVKDSPAAPVLVRNTLGMKGSDKVTKQSGKAAILSAMMTPFAQAQVGSCFATCNCLDYREQKPVEMMQDLANMVNTGELKKGALDPVPVTTKLPTNENALLRSWEYTVATLGGDAEAGDMKKTLGSRVHNALVAVQDSPALGSELKKMDKGVSDAERRETTTRAAYDAAVLERNRLVPLFNADNAKYQAARDASIVDRDNKQREWEEAERAAVQARAEWDVKWENLKTAARGALAFAYDPTLTRGATATDQRSTKGGWRLKRSDNGEPVDSEEKLQACLKDAFTAELGPDANPAAIRRVVTSAAFTDSLVSAYADKGSLWAQETGGQAAPSKAVLFEGTPETKPLFPKASGSKAEKTEALLTGIVSGLKDSPDSAVTLGVSGIHAMRALPKHPSLDALKAAPDVGVAVRNELAKAKGLATNPLEEDRVKGLYDKALGSLVGDYLGGDLTGLEEEANRPAGGKTPKQLKDDILAKAGPALEKMYKDPAVAKKVLSAKIDGFLVQELFPQFVIADTNWGDASDRYLHVVAPDPDTGDPVLWVKGELSGSMTRETDNWVDAQWEYTTLKAS